MIRIIKKPGHDKTGKQIEIGDFIANYTWAVIAATKTEKSYYFLFPSEKILNDIKSGKINDVKELRKICWRIQIANTNKMTIITPESFDNTLNEDEEVNKAMELRKLILELND
jgi:hypothetical protein